MEGKENYIAYGKDTKIENHKRYMVNSRNKERNNIPIALKWPTHIQSLSITTCFSFLPFELRDWKRVFSDQLLYLKNV